MGGNKGVIKTNTAHKKSETTIWSPRPLGVKAVHDVWMETPVLKRLLSVSYLDSGD